MKKLKLVVLGSFYAGTLLFQSCEKELFFPFDQEDNQGTDTTFVLETDTTGGDEYGFDSDTTGDSGYDYSQDSGDSDSSFYDGGFNSEDSTDLAGSDGNSVYEDTLY